MARKRRADGRIQVQVDLGVSDGKRHRKYFYGRTLKEANAARDAWLEERERRSRVLAADADATMREWAEMWLASIKGTTQGTTHKSKAAAVRAQNSFRFTLGEIPVDFGDMRVRDVLPIHVQAYMRSLAGMSKGTIALRRGVLKSVLNAAVANRLIDRSPWQDIKCPKGTYTGHRALDENEQQLICSTWEKHRCGIWALTMLYTGMRREELAALYVSDVDFDAEQIHIQKAAVLKEGGRIKETKTEAGTRTVPILPPLAAPLRAAVAGAQSGRLFCSAGGDGLTETSFRQAWRSYMRFLNLHEGGTDKRRGRNVNGKATWIPAKIVVKSFSPHDLRYTYATILYDAGVDIKTAAALLGHSDISMTMKIYTQLSAMKKLKGIDALKAHFSEAKSDAKAAQE